MKIDHVNLTVVSIEDTLALLQIIYPDIHLLGEGRADSKYGAKRWTHYGSGDTYLALEQVEVMAPTLRPMNSFHGLNHLGLVVTDFERIVKEFEATGIKFSIAEDNEYRKRLYCYDMHGLEFEVIEYLSDDLSKRFSYPSDEQ